MASSLSTDFFRTKHSGVRWFSEYDTSCEINIYIYMYNRVLPKLRCTWLAIEHVSMHDKCFLLEEIRFTVDNVNDVARAARLPVVVRNTVT